MKGLPADRLIKKAKEFEKSGDILEVRRLYEDILSPHKIIIERYILKICPTYSGLHVLYLHFPKNILLKRTILSLFMIKFSLIILSILVVFIFSMLLIL